MFIYFCIYFDLCLFPKEFMPERLNGLILSQICDNDWKNLKSRRGDLGEIAQKSQAHKQQKMSTLDFEVSRYLEYLINNLSQI